MKCKTLALIPARAGSKSIKNKNLALLHNEPLLFYTIKAAKMASCIDEIVLSSDGDEILKYGESQGITTLKRPDELAQDLTQSYEVVLHTLQYYDCENLILLQPTSPFRNHNDIDEAFKIFKQNNSDTLISVSECDNKILKAFVVNENNTLQGICNNNYPFMPRQKLPKTYMSNGAIYILKSKLFMKNHSFLMDNTSYYVMSEEKSLDIDNYDDLKKAEQIANIN